MALLKLCLAVLCGITIKYSEATCGYESCHQPKEGFVNVHLVSHSHDDVGWLKTVDQYFYGHSQSRANAGVQYILDTVIDSLQRDENRRFIYVETAFFWKWWTEQNDKIKKIVRQLVENGQLEFIGGGWSMNDEAVTNYQSTIDQMTWGLRRLNDTFGSCGRPKIGWQIDPFGHSKEMANIFARLGFDAFIMVRIDYESREELERRKQMEFIWRGSDSLGQPSDIFSVVLPHHYSAPDGFCWDGLLCNSDPIITNKKSPLYNAKEKVDQFLYHVDTIAQYFNTSNVLVTMGDDFTYQDAEIWFTNIDKLISVANSRQVNGSKYNLMYSTPSCYVKAVYDETKGILNSTMKEDDFFPLYDDLSTFWTGYYTSRPNLKRYERTSNNLLQVCKQLFTVGNVSLENEESLTLLREAMGVLQHHDAITGTERQLVALDYARMLQIGVEECEKVSFLALSDLTRPKNSSQNSNDQTIEFFTCPLTNVSQCQLTETKKTFVVTVYNPLSRPVTKYVRLPVTGTAYSVKNPEGDDLITDILPIFAPILTLSGRKSNATNELIFVAENIPPIGFKSYYVTESNGNNVISKSVKPDTVIVTKSKNGVEMSPTSGFISAIVKNNVSYPVTQSFWYYKAGGNAYIFQPTGDAMVLSENATFEVFNGDLITEIRQEFMDTVYQTIRLYDNEDFVEFDWIIGGPNNNDTLIGNKQLITRFQTDLNSSDIFYTDANGRQMIKRTRKFNDSDLNFNTKVSGNYRPVTSIISLKDEQEELEFSVLTDRAQGGTSLKEGELELMIYRNEQSTGDDIGENLEGLDFAYRGSHFVLVGPSQNPNEEAQSISTLVHDISQRKLLDSLIFLSPIAEYSFDQYQSTYPMQFSALNQSLPPNINILTLEPWKDGGILLRLEHVFDKNEDNLWSKSASVDIKTLFSAFEVTSIQETTLGANQFLEENQRLNFTTTSQPIMSSDNIEETAANDSVITLNPSQIRTFIIEVK